MFGQYKKLEARVALLERLLETMAVNTITLAIDEAQAINDNKEPEAWRIRAGKARAASLSPERRKEIAKKAAVARWLGSDKKC